MLCAGREGRFPESREGSAHAVHPGRLGLKESFQFVHLVNFFPQRVSLGQFEVSSLCNMARAELGFCPAPKQPVGSTELKLPGSA